MNLVLVILFGVYVCAKADYSALSYNDRECGADLVNLWLDVVAVVDNSIGMTDDGLASIAGNIASVFSAGTRIGANSTEPRTTRLGIVTYNSDATVNADLNKFQSLDDVYNNVYSELNFTSTSSESFLSTGLDAALGLFESESVGTPRGHYPKVVIVYASAYRAAGENDPFPVANRLKTSGVTIITVAFDQTGDGLLLLQLANIASPGCNYTNVDQSQNLLGEIQGALLGANCFCPANWIQYRQNYSDLRSYRYGVCIQPVAMSSSWRAARMSCANRWKNSYMANEYNQIKHDFILDSIQNRIGFSQPFSYHIGLSMINGKWAWDQPSGWPQPELQSFYNWIQGYPLISSTLTAALNIQNSEDVETGWINTDHLKTGANYICETAACDTDNYCDSNGKNGGAWDGF